MDSIKIKINSKEIDLPVIKGSENEHGINITQLRKETGYITLDPGYANTGSCISNITFIDGEKGILRYRGYPIEELAGKVSFTETAFLLLYGDLPTIEQKKSSFVRSYLSNASFNFWGGSSTGSLKIISSAASVSEAAITICCPEGSSPVSEGHKSFKEHPASRSPAADTNVICRKEAIDLQPSIIEPILFWAL